MGYFLLTLMVLSVAGFLLYHRRPTLPPAVKEACMGIVASPFSTARGDIVHRTQTAAERALANAVATTKGGARIAPIGIALYVPGDLHALFVSLQDDLRTELIDFMLNELKVTAIPAFELLVHLDASRNDIDLVTWRYGEEEPLAPNRRPCTGLPPRRATQDALSTPAAGATSGWSDPAGAKSDDTEAGTAVDQPEDTAIDPAGPTALPWAELVTDDGFPYPITGDATVIGRGGTADVCLPFSSISRVHAAILRVDGKPYVEWRGGVNRVRVDGVLLEADQRLALRDGARITLSGSVTVQLRLLAEKAAA